MEVKFKKGWIAMDKCGTWKWFQNKPMIEGNFWVGDIKKPCTIYPQMIVYLELPKAKDWKKSLQEV